jgi:hypothetical protein
VLTNAHATLVAAWCRYIPQTNFAVRSVIIVPVPAAGGGGVVVNMKLTSEEAAQLLDSLPGGL